VGAEWGRSTICGGHAHWEPRGHQPAALDSLARADAIAAEDTRVTGASARALSHAGKADSGARDNEQRAADLYRRAARPEARTVALVTGRRHARNLRSGRDGRQKGARRRIQGGPDSGAERRGHPLSASGSPKGRFCSWFFFRQNQARDARRSSALGMLPYTLVFYEAPHRVVECVEDMSAALGPSASS